MLTMFLWCFGAISVAFFGVTIADYVQKVKEEEKKNGK